MAYNITIASVDRTSDVLARSVVIDDVINDQQNTCRLQLIDRSETGIPATDDEIVITLDDGTLIFGGYVMTVDMSSIGKTGTIVANISCVDYVRLLDRNLAHKTYEDMTDAEIIEDLVATYCQGVGITTTNVVEGVTIDQISFNYVQISQCLRRICDLTGRNWFIDYEKDIHYFPLTQTAAPFNINDAAGLIVEDGPTFTVGTLKNDATQFAATLTLADADPAQDGQVEYTESPFPTNFSASFDFRSYGGTQGGWAYFYWGCSATPRSITQTAGGYLLVFNEINNRIDLYFNGTLITSTNVSFSFMDNVKRQFGVEKQNQTIIVTFGGGILFEYTEINEALGGTLYGIGKDQNPSSSSPPPTDTTNFSFSEIPSRYWNLNISKDTSQLKNRVYVRGGTKLSDPVDYIEAGDGQKTVFVLPEKPHDVTVYVNTGAGYVEKTLGIKNIDTSGYDWYLNFQEKYIEQDAAGVVLDSGDQLKVNYSYDIPILVAVENTTSILENGVKEFAVFDKSIKTTVAARDRASAELTDYANDIVEGSFNTMTAGFVSGQYLNINLSDYGIDDDYLVQKVVARSIGGGTFEYEVSIASSKTMGIIRFLIELLESNKNLIELDDNEVLDELVNLSDSLLSDSITDNLTIDSAGPYRTWATDSLTSTVTRARWNLFEWGGNS